MNLNYANSEKKAYRYNGAAVPKGYYVDTKSKVSTGLVITDQIDDEGYSTGNEWVWVPVNSTVGNNDFYLTGSGKMAGATSVSYTKYSKLWQFTTDTETGINTRTELATPQATPSGSQNNRDPGILINGTAGEAANLSSINKRATNTPFTEEDGVKAVATQYVTDFDNMCDSVDTYGGFYIGRYELTSNGEKPGDSLVSKNWYYYYNQCLICGNNYSESGMIYGTLWDATMQWLAKTGYWVGSSGQSYCGYGNYRTEPIKVKNDTNIIIVKKQGTARILSTGQTSYTKSNNIYDLAGNCYDWTQEANAGTNRVHRGGMYNTGDSVGTFPSYRVVHPATQTHTFKTARPCLYIK